MNNKEKPPIGGAMLEAMFAYPQLGLSVADFIVEAIQSCGCEACPAEEWSARTNDLDFISANPHSSIHSFIADCLANRVLDCNLAFICKLHDECVTLSVSLYFSDAVVSISTKEDFLWGFSSDISNLDPIRLDAFYFICQKVCESKPPNRAVIGSEPCHVEQIALSSPTDQFRYEHALFFSSVQKAKLLDWYRNSYAHRWDNRMGREE